MAGRAAFAGSGRGYQPFLWRPVPSRSYLAENYGDYELICLKGLPSACETVEVNVATVGLWKNLNLYYEKYILMQQSFGWRHVLITIEKRVTM